MKEEEEVEENKVGVTAHCGSSRRTLQPHDVIGK